MNPGFQLIVGARSEEDVVKLAAAFGYLTRQQAVGYHRVEPVTVEGRAERVNLRDLAEDVRRQVSEQTGAVEIELGRRATPEDVRNLYDTIGKLAEKFGVDRDDMPIIPTRTGLRVLNFTGLDGQRFGGIIEVASDLAFGGGTIFPLRIIEGDLVGNNWEVYKGGEEYIKRLGGVTEVGSRGAAEGLGGEVSELPTGAATSARPSDLPGRLDDIYTTKIRPIEESYYERLREIAGSALAGGWENVPEELKPLVKAVIPDAEQRRAQPGVSTREEEASQSSLKRVLVSNNE
jgi:hypothetical protein